MVVVRRVTFERTLFEWLQLIRLLAVRSCDFKVTKRFHQTGVKVLRVLDGCVRTWRRIVNQTSRPHYAVQRFVCPLLGSLDSASCILQTARRGLTRNRKTADRARTRTTNATNGSFQPSHRSVIVMTSCCSKHRILSPHLFLSLSIRIAPTLRCDVSRNS